MYPQFRRENFEGIPPPNREGYPFRIVFAGRIERNKGVFDILEIARQVEELQPGLVRWDICGDGSELTQLIQKHGAMDLGSVVTIHGWTDPVRLRVLQGQSHLSIVPTRGDFAEGMAKTALEAILAGRPVIASSVTPALEILGAAATTVESENIPEYVEKISTIAKDRERYGALVSACKDIQELLYDKGNSFVSTLKRIIINDLRR
jgi:glycosyltransferase involved in cell wall biosynthesis